MLPFSLFKFVTVAAAMVNALVLGRPTPSSHQFTMTIYSCESGPCGYRNNVLVPFVSAAVPIGMKATYPMGTLLSVPFLRNKRMPGGRKHTGVVRIDDYCVGPCRQNHDPARGHRSSKLPVLDLYIGRGNHADTGSGAQLVTASKLPGRRDTLRGYGGRGC